ncbi:unnamed protein product [Allacma fusca]|uniref:CRAL-TRIO domain-containing protein n=1 Tax=Allacma fusca TaxID=39272 RepID=A0A8J2L7N4_9HEXA|nr:unnamed protein product [Allacma fusca]
MRGLFLMSSFKCLIGFTFGNVSARMGLPYFYLPVFLFLVLVPPPGSSYSIDNLENEIPTLKYLKTEGLDKWEAPQGLHKNFPYYLSGFDEDNRPIWVMEFGKWDVRGVVEKGGQDLKDLEKYMDQWVYRMMESMKIKSSPDNLVDEVIIIFDMDNYTLLQLNSIPTVAFLLKKIQQLRDAMNFVETGYVVNANFMAQALVSMVRPVMGQDMEKIEVYGTNKESWVSKLLKKLPQDQLAPGYGGISATANQLWVLYRRDLLSDICGLRPLLGSSAIFNKSVTKALNSPRTMMSALGKFCTFLFLAHWGTSDVLGRIEDRIPSLKGLFRGDLDTWEAPPYIQNNYRYYLSGFDYDNRPIWVVEFGKWDVRKIVEGGGQPLRDFDKYISQAVYRVINSTTLRSTPENPVWEVMGISDFDCYSLHQLNSLATMSYILKRARELRDAMQLLNNGYCINVNFVAERLINMLRPILGREMERVEVLGTNKSKWLPILLRRFPQDQLPFWYGGFRNFIPYRLYG